jgi:hypothetical protein
MEWNIYKRVRPQEKLKEFKTTLAIFGMMFYCSLLLYMVMFFSNLILYRTLGLNLITHFGAKHVGMDQKTIVETENTIDPLNGVV